jgi:multiple sugar transport system permease protein
MVFMWLYDSDFGLINYALQLVGITGPRWLGSTTWAMPSLILMGVWHSLGYKMVIYLAGLTSIPTEFYEAATVDGASDWQKLRYITVPLLTPVTLFILVTSTISSFQVFSNIYIMTQGGPLGSTNTIAYIIFQHAFQYFRMGLASAMAVVLLVLLAILAIIQLRIGRERTTYLG